MVNQRVFNKLFIAGEWVAPKPSATIASRCERRCRGRQASLRLWAIATTCVAGSDRCIDAAQGCNRETLRGSR